MNETTPGLTPDQIEGLASALVEGLQGLRDQDRQAVLGTLNSRYCQHCGADQSDGICYCTRDE